MLKPWRSGRLPTIIRFSSYSNAYRWVIRPITRRSRSTFAIIVLNLILSFL